MHVFAYMILWYESSERLESETTPAPKARGVVFIRLGHDSTSLCCLLSVNREHALLECRQRKARLQMLITVVCTEHILLKKHIFRRRYFCTRICVYFSEVFYFSFEWRLRGTQNHDWLKLLIARLRQGSVWAPTVLSAQRVTWGWPSSFEYRLLVIPEWVIVTLRGYEWRWRWWWPA